MNYQIILADRIDLRSEEGNITVISTAIKIQDVLPDTIIQAFHILCATVSQSVGIWNPYTNRYEYWKNS